MLICFLSGLHHARRQPRILISLPIAGRPLNSSWRILPNRHRAGGHLLQKDVGATRCRIRTKRHTRHHNCGAVTVLISHRARTSGNASRWGPLLNGLHVGSSRRIQRPERSLASLHAGCGKPPPVFAICRKAFVAMFKPCMPARASAVTLMMLSMVSRSGL